MDDFKKAQTKVVDVGGYGCPCCSPVACKKRSKAKKKLHKLARTIIKRNLKKQIKEEMETC
jgi:hypothetical protein